MQCMQVPTTWAALRSRALPVTARNMPALNTVDDATMTIDKCVKMAEAKGYKYAGLQAGTWCHAGNDISSYTTAATCSRRCSGNSLLTCGGGCANDIYKTSLWTAGALSNCVLLRLFTRTMSCVLKRFLIVASSNTVLLWLFLNLVVAFATL
jgi:hypothetical protein